jgi:hypothetical protein
LRILAFGTGIAYGSVKLGYLKVSKSFCRKKKSFPPPPDSLCVNLESDPSSSSSSPILQGVAASNAKKVAKEHH